MEWNTDGPIMLEAPGPGTVLLVPLTKMLRVPRNRPDQAFLEEKVIRMRGFDRKIRVAEAGPIDLSEFPIAFPPRSRITGVRAYHRGETEIVRKFNERGRATKKANIAQKWEALESWEIAEGEKASQAKLKRVRDLPPPALTAPAAKLVDAIVEVAADEGSTPDGEG